MDGAGRLVFSGTVREVLPDGTVVVDYDRGLGEGPEAMEDLQPRAFVMENVRGILSAKYEGKTIFPQILGDLEGAGYDLHALGGGEEVVKGAAWSLLLPFHTPNSSTTGCCTSRGLASDSSGDKNALSSCALPRLSQLSPKSGLPLGRLVGNGKSLRSLARGGILLFGLCFFAHHKKCHIKSPPHTSSASCRRPTRPFRPTRAPAPHTC